MCRGSEDDGEVKESRVESLEEEVDSLGEILKKQFEAEVSLWVLLVWLQLP